MHLAKDTIMLMQAYHKLEVVAAMLQSCMGWFFVASYKLFLSKNVQKY